MDRMLANGTGGTSPMAKVSRVIRFGITVHLTIAGVDVGLALCPQISHAFVVFLAMLGHLGD